MKTSQLKVLAEARKMSEGVRDFTDFDDWQSAARAKGLTIEAPDGKSASANDGWWKAKRDGVVVGTFSKREKDGWLEDYSLDPMPESGVNYDPSVEDNILKVYSGDSEVARTALRNFPSEYHEWNSRDFQYFQFPTASVAARALEHILPEINNRMAKFDEAGSNRNSNASAGLTRKEYKDEADWLVKLAELWPDATIDMTGNSGLTKYVLPNGNVVATWDDKYEVGTILESGVVAESNSVTKDNLIDNKYYTLSQSGEMNGPFADKREARSAAAKWGTPFSIHPRAAYPTPDSCLYGTGAEIKSFLNKPTTEVSVGKTRKSNKVQNYSDFESWSSEAKSLGYKVAPLDPSIGSGEPGTYPTHRAFLPHDPKPKPGDVLGVSCVGLFFGTRNYGWLDFYHQITEAAPMDGGQFISSVLGKFQTKFPGITGKDLEAYLFDVPRDNLSAAYKELVAAYPYGDDLEALVRDQILTSKEADLVFDILGGYQMESLAASKSPLTESQITDLFSKVGHTEVKLIDENKFVVTTARDHKAARLISLFHEMATVFPRLERYEYDCVGGVHSMTVYLKTPRV